MCTRSTVSVSFFGTLGSGLGKWASLTRATRLTRTGLVRSASYAPPPHHCFSLETPARTGPTLGRRKRVHSSRRILGEAQSPAGGEKLSLSELASIRPHTPFSTSPRSARAARQNRADSSVVQITDAKGLDGSGGSGISNAQLVQNHIARREVGSARSWLTRGTGVNWDLQRSGKSVRVAPTAEPCPGSADARHRLKKVRGGLGARETGPAASVLATRRNNREITNGFRTRMPVVCPRDHFRTQETPGGVGRRQKRSRTGRQRE